MSQDILKSIEIYYGTDFSIDALLKKYDDLKSSIPQQDADLSHPIVRLVNGILIDAIQKKASGHSF